MDKERQVVKKLINNHHPGILQERIFSNTIFLVCFCNIFLCAWRPSSGFSQATAKRNDITSRLTCQLPCRSIRAEQTAEASQG